MPFFDYGYPWLMNLVANADVPDDNFEKEEGALELDALAQEIGDKKELYNYDVQINLQVYDTPLNDYCQLVLTFGFIVMFGAAWPLTPLVVMGYVISQSFIDQKRMLLQTQRPQFESAYDIGVWWRIMDLMGFVGLVVNMLLLCITTNYFQEKNNLSNFHTAIYVAIIEHAIISIRLFIAAQISDTSDVVVNCVALDDLMEDIYKQASIDQAHRIKVLEAARSLKHKQMMARRKKGTDAAEV